MIFFIFGKFLMWPEGLHSYYAYRLSVAKNYNKQIEIVCTNLMVQLSRIQGHEICIVLYAHLDGDCWLY